MAKRKSWKIDPDAVAVTEVDLDEEPITLPSGRVLDEKAAEQFGREVADRAAARRRAGRPSLSGAGLHSPHMSVRVKPELKGAVDKIAERDGVRASDVLRAALEEYVDAHG
jgi:hypothetical protein